LEQRLPQDQNQAPLVSAHSSAARRKLVAPSFVAEVGVVVLQFPALQHPADPVFVLLQPNQVQKLLQKEIERAGFDRRHDQKVF